MTGDGTFGSRLQLPRRRLELVDRLVHSLRGRRLQLHGHRFGFFDGACDQIWGGVRWGADSSNLT